MNKQQFDEAISLLRRTQQSLTSAEMYSKLNRETSGLLRDVNGFLNDPNQITMPLLVDELEQ